MVKPTPTAQVSVDDMTHVVFAEEFTATWCVYCPSAAENLMKVYEDVPNEPYYHDHFFFVALITDVNDKADDRMGDYPDVTGYPTVVFDGNDEKVSGGQSDTSGYEQAIDTTGQRDDTDISLNIHMDHLGADKLDVTVGMTWNEDASLGNPTFNGFVRAYIVEKISRYDNYDGDPYHFGFLDYAFEQSVELNPHEELVLNTVWTGGDHQDSNGNDFSDIDYENINIFVAFFNDESTSSDKYSLQSAFAIPPVIEIEPFEGVQGGTIELQGSVVSKKSQVGKVYYKWNDDEWIDSSLPEFNGDFTLNIDTAQVENGLQQLSIKTNNRGSSNIETIDIEILNDYEAPTIDVVSHDDGETVEAIVVLEVEAVDDNQVSDVEFKLNDGDWRRMYYSQDDSYITSWNTQEANAGNGDHLLTFRAEDMSGNQVEGMLNLTVFNEGDVTYPYLNIIEPLEEIYNSRVKVVAEAADPEGIAEIKYKVDEGDWKELDNSEEDFYDAYWIPTTDGWHWLYVTVTDEAGYTTNLSAKFETDSTPPLILLDADKDVSATAEFSVSVTDYSNLQSLRYRISSGDWIDLELIDGNADFSWDSTDINDGKCLLEVECTDAHGASSTLRKNLDVKNEGLIHSAIPNEIESGRVTKVSAVIDYENPKAVNVVIAKYVDGVCADGIRIPMYQEGNYYHSDLYFEEDGVYLYSIEVDTWHGKLSSAGQNIVVTGAQEVVTEEKSEEKLVSPSILFSILALIFISNRRRI